MIEHLMKMEGLAKEALGTRGELKKIPTNKLIPHMIQTFVDSGKNLASDHTILVDSISRELGKRAKGTSNPKDLRRQVSDRVSQITDKFYPEHKQKFEQMKEEARPKPQVSEQPKPSSQDDDDPVVSKLKTAFVSGSDEFHSVLAEMERKAKAEQLSDLIKRGKFDDARQLFEQMHSKSPSKATASPRDAVPNDSEKAHEPGFAQKQEKIVSLPDESLMPDQSPEKRATNHREATQQAARTNTADSPKKIDEKDELDKIWNEYSADPDYAHLLEYREPHHLIPMKYEIQNEFPGSSDEEAHSMANHFIKRNKEKYDKDSALESMSSIGKSPSIDSLKTKKKKVKDTSVSWAKEPEMPSSPPPAAQEKPKKKALSSRKPKT